MSVYTLMQFKNYLNTMNAKACMKDELHAVLLRFSNYTIQRLGIVYLKKIAIATLYHHT